MRLWLRPSEPGAHLPHKASLRRVEVRGERDGRFFILGALSPDDRIADKGAFKLNDQILLRVQAEVPRG